MMMKTKLLLPLLLAATLSACSSTYTYKPAEDMSKFYADKLSCENLYTMGFNIWGNKVYGDIYKEGPARDCMMAKGYQSSTLSYGSN
jgi:outer membrane lipoprotein-sorting protein